MEALVCEGEDFPERKATFIWKNEQEWKDLDVKQQGTSQNTVKWVCVGNRFKKDIDKDEMYSHPLSSEEIIEVKQ